MLNSALKFGTTRGATKRRTIAPPEELERPTLVFDSDSQPGALVSVTTMQDRLGNPVIAAIHLGKRSGRLVVNDIASIYSKEGAEETIRRWARQGRLRYFDQEKALGAPTTGPLYLGKVVQEARGPGKNILSSADVFKDSGKAGTGAEEPPVFARNTVPTESQEAVPGTNDETTVEAPAPRKIAAQEEGQPPAAASISGVDASRDVPLAGGKSTAADPVTGRKTTCIDRDMPRHVWVPEHDYKGKTTPGQWVDTHAEIHAHEEGEEPQLDALGYEAAHDGPGNDATRRYLAERGVDPHVYQNVIRPHLEAIREKAEQSRATDIPHDLDRRPYEDSGQGHLLRQDREIAADLYRDSGRTVAGGAPGPGLDSVLPALAAGGGEPIGRFAELSGVHQNLWQAYRDAAALTGLHLDIDVVHGPVDMLADVRYSLGLRRIELTQAVGMLTWTILSMASRFNISRHFRIQRCQSSWAWMESMNQPPFTMLTIGSRDLPDSIWLNTAPMPVWNSKCSSCSHLRSLKLIG